jgi:hypothetical protein
VLVRAGGSVGRTDEKKFQAGAIALSAALFSGQSKLTAFDCNAGRIMSLPHDNGMYIFEPAAARRLRDPVLIAARQLHK